MWEIDEGPYCNKRAFRSTAVRYTVIYYKWGKHDVTVCVGIICNNVWIGFYFEKYKLTLHLKKNTGNITAHLNFMCSVGGTENTVTLSVANM